ncbi:CLUMA_CG013841, isoform A [Clunio marinus]|uniref:Facilitated trehalose transporter Tret1 n=1 Tax=Clunio marinus TaxID=568069 RepID=A0A1J1IK07_9DIPT|nr:CLUMA_CG013841, isoform A [Clunio marinus]
MADGSELNQYRIVGSVESEHKTVYKIEDGKKWRQFLAATNLSSVALGTTLGWTSPGLPKLLDETHSDSPLYFIPSKDEISWIGSLLAVGALFAPFVAGPLTDIIGRKWTLLSSSIFFILSYILLILTCNVPQIYVARLLQGFGVGFVMTAQTMYIGEISSTDCRGSLGSLMQIGIVVGILYVYSIGPYVGYIAFQFFCLIIPIVFVVTFYFMPDSPHFYISKGRKEDALNSLKFLRGKSSEGVQEEIDSIQESVEKSMKNKGSKNINEKITKNLALLSFIALIITVGLVTFQQFSGINAVLFYGQSIFESAGSSMDPAIATITIGIVQVLASCCTPLVVDRLGRKIILLVSSAGMAIGLGLLGFFFFLDHQGSDVTNISWLPITSLIGIVIIYSVGFGPLPWVVFGEMFPPNVKSTASSIVTSVCWIFGFAVTKWFSALQDSIGSYGAFWLFGVCCCFAFFFTLSLVMETKGMSLQQIQDKLNGR